MRKVFAQCTKELVQFWRDRLTVALAFILPLATLFVFGYGIRLEIKNIPIIVQNFDDGKLGRDLIDRLYDNEQFLPFRWRGRDVVADALNFGKPKAAIVIPPEFSRTIKAGRVGKFQALIDATDVNNARVIKNSIIATNNFFMQENGLIPINTPIKPEVRLWFNPGRKESLYVVPGVFGLIFWIYPSLLSAIAMVKEKEQGTILQAYASSITASQLIAGKALAYVIIGLLEAIFIITIAVILFGFFFVGDPTPFLVSTVIFIAGAVCFGLMIGTASKDQSSSVQWVATAGFTTSFLLSGFLYPLRNITFPLSLLSNIVPARYYVQLSRDSFVRGAGWISDWYMPLVLALLGFIYFRAAVKRLGRMQITS